MTIRMMTADDISSVIPIYLDYYNNCEGSCWTSEKAFRRLHQVICMDDAYSLILENDGHTVGFAMGYFKQYDDIVGYTLEEILISLPFQHQGLGSLLLSALEQQVRENGASLLELLSVNDSLHEHFYDKAGYYKPSSLIPRAKWLTGPDPKEAQ